MFLLGKTHLPITPYHSVSSDTKDEEVDIHPSIHHENNPGCQKTFLYDVQILFQALMQNSPFSFRKAALLH